MKSNYRKIGDYIEEVNNINTDLSVTYLRGISSIYKKFITSKANIVGVDFLDYKIVKKDQFAYNPNTARMGDKIPIALNNAEDCIVSKIYPVFEIVKKDKLNSEYLMMWFRRPEFDRYARFKSHGSAREVFDWEEMCNVELPVPHIDKQKEVVKKYNVLINRITLNNRFIADLEETAQTIYKQWFVDFEFPNENGKSYKSNGGKMKFNEKIKKDIPEGWDVKNLEFFIDNTIGGDWGVSIPNGNYTKEVICIRGTDIPNFKIGQLGDSPKRYILSQNYKDKLLSSGQLVIEISGGSPIQSTGRSTLILDEHIKYAESPLICSNFCRALSLKDSLYCGFFYSYINYLYKGDVLFNFENSTIGLKNFNLNGFLSEQLSVIPNDKIIKKYNEIYFKILKTMFFYGRQNEILNNNQNMLLSNLLLAKSKNNI